MENERGLELWMLTEASYPKLDPAMDIINNALDAGPAPAVPKEEDK